jgi:hypothetical protein
VTRAEWLASLKSGSEVVLKNDGFYWLFRVDGRKAHQIVLAPYSEHHDPVYIDASSGFGNRCRIDPLTEESRAAVRKTSALQTLEHFSQWNRLPVDVLEQVVALISIDRSRADEARSG